MKVLRLLFNNVLFIFSLFILLNNCVSAQKSTSNLNIVRSERQLKKDVDFAYRKLQKLHPNLYWYISKKELDFKFDSFKRTINVPMTSNDFFFKFSPIVASVKQGHTRLGRSGAKDYSTARFDYEIFNNKLYIVKNNWSSRDIKPGTEVVSINNIKAEDIIAKYRNTFSSDGYNQTFINKGTCIMFEKYFKYENIPADSIVYQLNYRDTMSTVCLNCKVVTDSSIIIKRENVTIQNTQLSFLAPDSSIALMKINEFTENNNLFYLNSFKQLKDQKTEVLILDLRNNFGGRISDAFNLYSYLTDSDFYFVDKSQITSRTSILHTRQFRNASLKGKTIIAAFTPLRICFIIARFCKVTKENKNKYLFPLAESKLSHPNPGNFKGKVYVLINGGSYSSASILSANLKGSKRAVFVGEETGGAYNGCVAGIIPFFSLPHSKLYMTFGITLIQPHYKTSTEGRGIFPDIEIKPTLEDRINEKDPELQWILNDINQSSQKGE